jgi:GntR family phosphonate transport system transcriptional regulator
MTQTDEHDRDLARWRQIMGQLERQIDCGALPPGARLPTEAQMAAQYGVNRHTVRRALEELSRNGLIRIEQGRGSFVTEDVLDYRISSRTRFSEWIRRHNKEPSGEVLRLDEIAADANVALALQVPPGAPVVLFERLGFADARPVSLGSHHFSAVALPGLLAALRTNTAISDALASVGVLDYRRAITRVSARMPTSAEAALLRMPRGRPVLVSESINVDGAGRVVEFGIARYPTPRVQVVFEP